MKEKLIRFNVRFYWKGSDEQPNSVAIDVQCESAQLPERIAYYRNILAHNIEQVRVFVNFEYRPEYAVPRTHSK